MNLFRRFVLLSLVSVYLLIFIGSLVRATGSGMGCPDWPKCYGFWVPPTTSFLPSNEWYDKVFETRRSKNERLLKVFAFLGWDGLSKRIEEHPEIFEKEEMNITKTWIEYLNRLFGVLTGLFLLLMTFFSFFTNFKKSQLISLSLALLFVTGFQGWLGSLVVSTSLVPGMISLHMILALLMVALLSVMMEMASKKNKSDDSEPYFPVYELLSFFVFGFQLYLGLKVRQNVDEQFFLKTPIGEIINAVSAHVSLHQFVGFLLVLLFFFSYYNFTTRRFSVGRLTWYYRVWGVSLLLELGIGLMFQFFGLMAWAQPFHLLFASLVFGMNFSLLYYYFTRFRLNPLSLPLL